MRDNNCTQEYSTIFSVFNYNAILQNTNPVVTQFIDFIQY